jgi:hypothetical protein
VETESEFAFSLEWSINGDLAASSPVIAEKSGWVSVFLGSGEEDYPSGEYKFVIYVAKTRKLSKTLYVLDE